VAAVALEEMGQETRQVAVVLEVTRKALFNFCRGLTLFK
jgi:hypothetical protein